MLARRCQREFAPCLVSLLRSHPSPTTTTGIPPPPSYVPQTSGHRRALGPSCFLVQNLVKKSLKIDAEDRSRRGCACRSLAPLHLQSRTFSGAVQAVHDSSSREEKREEQMEVRRRTGALFVLACTVGSLGLFVSPVVQGRESPSMSFVKKTIASHSIVIFSKSYCPYCKRAKSVFKDLNETPFVVELDVREDGPKIQEALSQLVKRHTVPQVFIDGEHIGGSDDTVEAYRTGRLKQLLGFRQSGEQDLR